jgi:hypothetical protein
MDRRRATRPHESRDGVSHQLRSTSWTSAALIEQCPRPPGRLSVCQCCSRPSLDDEKLAEAELEDHNSLLPQDCTGLWSHPAQPHGPVCPLRTDVNLRADLSRAPSLTWPSTRCPCVATCLSPSWHLRELMVVRLPVPLPAPTVRNNCDSSSAQQPTWACGKSLPRSEKSPVGVCAPWSSEAPSLPKWCSRATSWRHPKRPTRDARGTPSQDS